MQITQNMTQGHIFLPHTS